MVSVSVILLLVAFAHNLKHPPLVPQTKFLFESIFLLHSFRSIRTFRKENFANKLDRWFCSFCHSAIRFHLLAYDCDTPNGTHSPFKYRTIERKHLVSFILHNMLWPNEPSRLMDIWVLLQCCMHTVLRYSNRYSTSSSFSYYYGYDYY